MITQVNQAIRINGLEMESFRDPAKLQDYLNGTFARNLGYFVMGQNMVYTKNTHESHMDETIFTATLYVATKGDYLAQQGLVAPTPYSEAAVQLEQDGYERGVRVALASVAAKADGMKDDRLKRNQHAATVLIETATEIEELLL